RRQRANWQRGGNLRARAPWRHESRLHLGRVPAALRRAFRPAAGAGAGPVVASVLGGEPQVIAGAGQEPDPTVASQKIPGMIGAATPAGRASDVAAPVTTGDGAAAVAPAGAPCPAGPACCSASKFTSARS